MDLPGDLGMHGGGGGGNSKVDKRFGWCKEVPLSNIYTSSLPRYCIYLLTRIYLGVRAKAAD